MRTTRTTGMGVAAAALVVAASVVSLLRGDDHLPWTKVGFAITAAIAIALGEAIRTTLDDQSSAPISFAAGIALAMTAVVGSQSFVVGTADVVLVMAIAMGVGGAARIFTGSPLAVNDMVARLLGVALTSVLARDLGAPNGVTWVADPAHPRWLAALALIGTAFPGVSLELMLRAWTRASQAGVPFLPALKEDLVSGGGLGVAVITAGPVIVLIRPVLGVWAIPLGLGPLILAQFSMRRHAAVRSTYRQTISALSRLSDLTGYTAPGHPARVADLSVRVGRELTMGTEELTRLEYAALLHDLGQVALRVPIPRGATLLAAPSDQQRIANDGARIVRGTGVLDDVAHTLEHQTTPYRQVREFGAQLPRNARVIKVVNAFDDLTEGSVQPETVAAAMERIHLGLGYEYDPAVVDALQRVLARRAGTW